MKMIKTCFSLALFIMSTSYSYSDYFDKADDLIPYIKDKCTSIELNQFSAELIHVENKNPLEDSEIKKWVNETLKKMKIDEKHSEYSSMYQSLYKEHQFQTTNILRKVKVIKSNEFYVLSQLPVTFDDLKNKEHIFKDGRQFYSTLINDYKTNTSYLVDHMYKKILETKGNTWSEESELTNMFVPEGSMIALFLLTNEKSKTKWSLQKSNESKVNENYENYDFNFVRRNGVKVSRKYQFFQSESDFQLRKIELISNAKTIKTVEWSDFQYDQEIQSSIAKKYKVVHYDNDKPTSQKEYQLGSYKINSAADDINSISDVIKKFKGYQFTRKIEGKSTIETVGIVGESVFK